MSELARTIRRDLREAGFGQRQVSVRTGRGSIDTSISITVKVPVALAPFRAVAERHSRVRRCAYSHDLLGGGNVIVHVSYSSGVLTAYAAESGITDAVRRLFQSPAAGGEQYQRPVEVGGFRLSLEYGDLVVERAADGWSHTIESHIHCGRSHASHYVARATLNAPPLEACATSEDAAA